MSTPDSGQLAERIAARLSAAALEAFPTTFLQVDDIFDQKTYRELVRRLPSTAVMDYIEHPDAILEDGTRTRKLLALAEDTLDRLSETDRAFWRAIMLALTSPVVSRALCERFGADLRARFGEQIPDLVPVPIIYRDFPGYRIGVHPDSPSKIATFQLYLPSDESQAHLGTVFYEKAGDGFRAARRNSFKPNSGYAFPRTATSWHGVEAIPANEFARNSIALTLYIAGQEYSSPAHPSSPPDHQPLPRHDQGYLEKLTDLGLSAPQIMDTPAGPIRYVPDGAGWRFQTILWKEPETLTWLDELPAESIFWDIGANVVIYSLYAALRGHDVFAFEPHFANYFQLCANIMANGLSEKVSAFCVACSGASEQSSFFLADTKFGASMSNFGAAIDFRGRDFEPAFRQAFIGLTVDDLCFKMGVPQPTCIKLDVDGIEAEILAGGSRVLGDARLLSVSVELVETDSSQVEMVHDTLSAAGLVFKHKKANPVFRDTPTGDVLNYLYVRL